MDRECFWCGCSDKAALLHMMEPTTCGNCKGEPSSVLTSRRELWLKGYRSRNVNVNGVPYYWTHKPDETVIFLRYHTTGGVAADEPVTLGEVRAVQGEFPFRWEVYGTRGPLEAPLGWSGTCGTLREATDKVYQRLHHVIAQRENQRAFSEKMAGKFETWIQGVNA